MVLKKYRRAGLLLILFACAVTCWAQSARFSRLEAEIVEDRLRQYRGRDAERGNTLKRLFKEAGCRGDRLREQPVSRADAPNVLCTLAGETEDAIVVGAHFDRVDAGDGVVDNWSGASLLPSLYQSLLSSKRKHTFIFIGFSDEEEGFIGSRFYVNQLSEEELASIQAMVNLDTLGLDSTKVWTSQSDPGLVGLLNQVAEKMRLPLHTVDVDGMGNSDGSSFRKRGIPTITLHSVTWRNMQYLHSNKDKFKAIDFDDYYDSYKLIAAFLAILDQREFRLKAPGHDSGRDE